MPLVTVLGEGRDPGELERVDEAGDLELIGDAGGHHAIVGDRALGLVGEERHPTMRRDVVRQERAVRGATGRVVDRAVDRLETER